MNTPAPRDDLATSQPDSPDAAARTRLRSLGSRVTEPRVRVLAVLMQGDEPLSHQAVCDALPDDAGIDRVTVYRVLDWLVAGGIVHKTAGADRVAGFCRLAQCGLPPPVTYPATSKRSLATKLRPSSGPDPSGAKRARGPGTKAPKSFT